MKGLKENVIVGHLIPLQVVEGIPKHLSSWKPDNDDQMVGTGSGVT
ncbi:MAG: hypothetical protein R2813_07140 [Flavobacteriales bacterium]